MRDIWVFPFLFFFLLSFLIISRHLASSAAVVLTTSSQHILSHINECDALLQFSSSFTVTGDASYEYCDDYGPITTSYPKTASWKSGSDCCSWAGVTCHPVAHRLRELNLDGIDMSRVSPMSLANFSSSGLTSLSLSGCNLRGIVPIDIFHLPNLRSLSLSDNYYLTGTLPQTKNWTSPLVSLNLSSTEFSGSIPASVGNLTSMTILDLRFAQFTGSIPLTFGNLVHLTHLDLGYNMISGGIPEWFWRVGRDTLTYLDFAYNNFNGPLPDLPPSMVNFYASSNNFSGEIPSSICRAKSLNHLDLSINKLSGTIPRCLGDLKSLSSFDASSNNFSGEIPSSICQASSLEELVLSNNRFNGTIPRCLGDLKSLLLFDASSNNFSGAIPSSICQAKSLEELVLSNNRLSGTIPGCLGNLNSLYASNNSLTGEIPSSVCQMGNLSRLFQLDLSYNLLQGPLPQSLANCTSLQSLNVSHNAIIDTFPRWLNAFYGLETLDLQSNRFHRAIEIPLPPQISYLSLSNNELSGQLPINFLLNSTVYFIDLANNSFKGPLPIPSPSIRYYSISKNEFNGDIPYQLCSATQLEIINLSNNCLTGTIPHCLMNFIDSLSVLDLQGNQFVGQIPEIISPGNNWVRTIRLGQNQLGGMLPRSLTSCKNLEVLDLGENELEGHFPYYLDTLPYLQVLILRSNMFRGPVDSSKRTSHPFPKLRILDLSDNSFSGRLPAEYIANLIAMKNEEKCGLHYMGQDYYEDTISVVMKGTELVLVKIMTVFTTIDLSRNFFEGEIPEAIRDLKALKGLNISHNNLAGRIPPSVENLTNLEWLDLSSNKLNGEIPRGLANLTYLTTLNLSYNQLVGPIPHGPQMDTFNHSFDGNPGLCGPPLSNPCDTLEQSPPHSTSPEEEEGQWIEWRAVAMGCGCGLILGISVGYTMLETGRPRWLVRMAERKRHRKTNRLNRNAAPRNLLRQNNQEEHHRPMRWETRQKMVRGGSIERSGNLSV
ncbi:hypothetical protein CRG98_025803 [Punica granatum]|uniref:Leucine-rich repeat-containing N-terminal plant-type domain-containing protein n=1 Tax=Punica granatum TaxID=22663 RepID=A0A2I0JC37_PUNGR|nr:hypothetical protein CRG98_025803 [Punica granatum]